MEIRNIIKTVLKESYVEKVQKTLDKYGLATTLKMFGNDVNKLSKMLNMSEIELLEKYNPFETIFTDEEFENSLFDTMTFIKDKPNIFYPRLKNNPIKEVVEYIIDMTIDDFHSKLVNFETTEWIIPETPKLLYLRYGDLLKNNSLFKNLYKQYTSNTRKLDEEMFEYARTLKNARKQGSGLRFPKSAIKANPNRFRPYSREQVDESLHKTKHFYGFLGLPNYWVDDNDKNYPDKFFNDKEYEDKIFDNFFDMDKEFGHKNSLFGTRGLEPGNPNRTSKSFNQYVERFGPMIVRILKKENIQESIKKITCKCGWSWKLKDGGNDPYTCHKCGRINSMKNIKEETNKDLSPILKNLLNKLLVKHHKDILCGVKVTHPSDRESVGIKHKNYEVILFFFGDEEEEMTYKERQKYNKLEDEAFDLVYKYTNQYADVYSKFLKSCDE